jgi:hypothetical protein
MLSQPQNSSAISNGKIVDTATSITYVHEQILIVLLMCAHLSKIIVMKHHQFIMDKS